MKKVLKKGEIATILTIATFVLVTAASIISSVFLTKSRQTTKSLAQEGWKCPGGNCNQCYNEWWWDQGCFDLADNPPQPKESNICRCSDMNTCVKYDDTLKEYARVPNGTSGSTWCGNDCRRHPEAVETATICSPSAPSATSAPVVTSTPAPSNTPIRLSPTPSPGTTLVIPTSTPATASITLPPTPTIEIVVFQPSATLTPKPTLHTSPTPTPSPTPESSSSPCPSNFCQAPSITQSPTITPQEVDKKVIIGPIHPSYLERLPNLQFDKVAVCYAVRGGFISGLWDKFDPDCYEIPPEKFRKEDAPGNLVTIYYFSYPPNLRLGKDEWFCIWEKKDPPGYFCVAKIN